MKCCSESPVYFINHENLNNAELNELYRQLGEIEEKESFCIEAGLFDHLPKIREQMIPLKRQINKLEGVVIYPEVQ